MSKIITNEMYINKLKQKNPDIVPCEEYIKSTTPIMHHCLKHDIFWKISPSNALKGKGCAACRSEKLKKRFLKTNEQYKKELSEKNPNLEVLEEYVDSNTPILHRCIKHNVKWKIIPTNALKGQGCYKCKSEKLSKIGFKSYDQYLEELHNSNPHITVEEPYVGTKIPILHHCSLHNVYYKVAPCNALKSYGCPQCTKEHFKKTISFSTEQFKEILSIKNPDIDLVGEYINFSTHTTFYCKKHKKYWETIPNNVIKGCGCPQCKSEKIIKSNRVSSSDYEIRLKAKNPNVIAVEDYINIKTPILHKCLIHNFEWNTSPASVLSGCGCPKCRSEKISQKTLKTHHKYLEEINKINPYVIPLEKYRGANIPILHKCLLDGYEWNITPTNILSGYGCPQCNESKGERKIRIWLQKNKISYIFQHKYIDCKDINPLPFDFYLPDYNLCIEYDGEQHYKANDYFGGIEKLKIQQKHDKIKNEYCKNNGILLLRIQYYKYKNIEEELDNFLFN